MKRLLWFGSCVVLCTTLQVEPLQSIETGGLLLAGQQEVSGDVILEKDNEWPRSILSNSESIQNYDAAEPSEDLGSKYTKGRIWSVIGAASLILALSVFGVFLPDIIKAIQIRSKRNSDDYSFVRLLVESLCNSFAAGGFWGLALIHVLKEAIDSLDELRWGLKVGGQYCNGAYLLICAGYLVMLAIQAGASTTQRRPGKERAGYTSAEIEQHRALVDAAVASLALTFHAFFEGMVIGMRSSPMLVWITAASVAGHKWAEAFALSQRMGSDKLSTARRITMLSVFLLSTPIGCLVGIPLGALEESAVSGIMSALSCGILVYVAGETTSEVFNGGDCHHVALIQPEAANENSVSEDLERIDSASVGHTNLTSAIERIESSYLILFGRLILMFCGMCLLAGMMLMEMKTHSVIYQD
eukprot:Protomagalhaensia_wolfi_Nauph_80__809@NODE_1469_length_1513_cov_203_896879_g1136_i0_p1_GENE_NODE_1469_length_1513_cov_203_896879_g1136_i0NODE_1469_length_1513_cov_203_896879_g1136_i0_p1_ORF_typecomplete_len414_score39_62Zip/PF02535_22/1_3e34DUF5367/PF17329_2/3_9e02DUF5367/PF17329_2/1_3e03DUF5367/PF17329_2/5_4_NODE_1469_length_1513_cov_203_896879_g1136_i02231464